MNELVFAVDDSILFQTAIKRGLDSHYNIKTFSSGQELFAELENSIPELILLDIEMPVMGGFEVLRVLKADERFRQIPIIMLSARSDEKTEANGFDLGVVDFIHKPFSLSILIRRVNSHIGIEQIIKSRTKELKEANSTLERLHHSLIYIMSDIIESRDQDTGGHVERCINYASALIKAMIEQGVYAEEISKWDIDTVIACVALHDIGKICVTDTILNKPGKLSTEEFDVMRTHTSHGAALIQRVIARVGDDKFLYAARLFAEYHHEYWDGTGYPHRLRGTSIPLEGRIMAVADVYDALVSDRPYKRGISPELAEKIILESSGKQFDPQIVEVFYSIRSQFAEIKRTYDTNPVHRV